MFQAGKFGLQRTQGSLSQPVSEFPLLSAEIPHFQKHKQALTVDFRLIRLPQKKRSFQLHFGGGFENFFLDIRRPVRAPI
ncbi:hypothetical protein DQG23_25945 [Paenibacillus contaminans]|uniref:Uncharacterized protein n=1 Tax=Paenibacillus contaminans TaxID=450362 RepID=A0A329MF60_9BACL|nr:hypothetical protein DQG23_25945 [Paenibacillus contaminans]